MTDPFEARAREITDAWLKRAGGCGYPSREPELVEAIVAALRSVVEAERARCLSIAAEYLPAGLRAAMANGTQLYSDADAVAMCAREIAKDERIAALETALKDFDPSLVAAEAALGNDLTDRASVMVPAGVLRRARTLLAGREHNEPEQANG